MKISELSVSFQESNATMLNNISLLLRLLQKYDLAITWDNQHLIFPPLLPTHLSLNTIVSDLLILTILLIPLSQSSHCRASIISSSSVIKFKDNSQLPINPSKSTSLHMKYLARIKKDDPQLFPYIRRFYHLVFIPSCFWSRFFTRVLGDKQLQRTFINYFLVDLPANEKIRTILLAECSWIVCQTGIELRYYDCCLLRINQIDITSSTIDDEISYNYLNTIFQFDTDEEQKKRILPFNDQGSLIEILICTSDLQMIIDTTTDDKDFNPFIIELVVQYETIGRILTILMSHFDALLEDWYPEMGTRFVQNSKGDYLVNRFVPCHRCLEENSQAEKFVCQTVWLETLMMLVEKKTAVQCEVHGEISLKSIAPDLVCSSLFIWKM